MTGQIRQRARISPGAAGRLNAAARPQALPGMGAAAGMSSMPARSMAPAGTAMSEVGCPADIQSVLGKCVARGAQRPLGGMRVSLYGKEFRRWDDSIK